MHSGIKGTLSLSRKMRLSFLQMQRDVGGAGKKQMKPCQRKRVCQKHMVVFRVINSTIKGTVN